eukprot:scaffold8993_cov207-Skeletonema_marinoi.AAC.45
MELGIPNTPDTKAKEEGCCRHRLPFFIRAQRGLLPLLLSESDTTPKYEEPRVAHQGDRSSSPTVVDPSDVSSMTSTSVPYQSASTTIQQPTHVPTTILITMKSNPTLYSNTSTNDIQLSKDSNEASSTTTFTNAASTFSSWVRPNSQTSVVTSSSNASSSTFSSWVRPNPLMLSNTDASASAAATTAECAVIPQVEV